MKLFSIVIPTRERPSLVERLLYSIEIQNFYDLEVIVSDCSETEDTYNVVKNSKINKYIKYVKNNKQTMTENWNSAISFIDAENIIFLSDKCLLKKGALNYLAIKMSNCKYEAITWCLDSFYLSTNAIKLNNSYENTVLKSKDMIKSILGANVKEFDKSPFYGNSCVKKSVYERIISKFKYMSFDVNPDYTMTMQILLNIENFEIINKNLTLLQFPDYYTSWGNGYNYYINKKNIQFNCDAIKLNKRRAYLKYYYLDNQMILINLILADVVFIIEKYEKNIFDYIKQEELIELYAFRILNEVKDRYYLGVNMDNEFVDFLKFFIINQSMFKIKTKIKLINKVFMTLCSKLIGRIKKFKIFKKIINTIKFKKTKKNIVTYTNFHEALNQNSIVLIN